MKKSMTTFKVPAIKKPLHSFITIRGGGLAYAENGNLKTYSNKTQVDKKVKELTEIGFNVSRTMFHPFLIIPISEPIEVNETTSTLLNIGRYGLKGFEICNKISPSKVLKVFNDFESEEKNYSESVFWAQKNLTLINI